MKQIQQDLYMAGQVIGPTELREIAHLAGGYTIIPSTGGWINASGELVHEDAYILRTITEGAWRADGVLEVAQGWAFSETDEDAILMTRELVTTRMVAC